MLQITNQNLFNQIVTEALAKVQNNSRWTRAINKAVEMLDSDQANWMEYDADTNQLVIWSQGSNNIYSSNGVCQCKAFELGQPCYHRALARLIRLYTEALNLPPTTPAKVLAFPTKPIHEDTYAIYCKTQPKEVEKIGGIRI